MAPAPINELIRDAYAAQHPGVPGEQAIQSVAVHLLTLYGVLVWGVRPENALWIRRRALRERGRARRGRYQWLEPPSFAGSLTVADIARATTPQERADVARCYVEAVWSLWAHQHEKRIVTWYEEFILPD
jgi:hypothetical protein